ncbi:MAG: fibrillarin-like rRNA/tRNA 2'-O-methyltransferase [Candidatus Thermoplasmatota archaeon]|nr:fibrillarin-like rRNA/tRNA 2'-O-methyltransferase [Candidatus Thermoplasmatota archaeon]
MEKDDDKVLIKKKNKLFTRNPITCKGISIYGEQLIQLNGVEYRSWNPYRSKLAAALLEKKFSLSLPEDSKILYLGAATGTTVSHLSDLLPHGWIYAVEHSPVSMKKLLTVVENRSNIIPIYEDANHPDRYFSVVPHVDVVYQDISQRNQADIFIRNMRCYLRSEGIGILMVKARSIDVSLVPKKAYQIVEHELLKHNLKIINSFSLSPFEKDHAVFMVNQKI